MATTTTTPDSWDQLWTNTLKKYHQQEAQLPPPTPENTLKALAGPEDEEPPFSTANFHQWKYHAIPIHIKSRS